MLKFATLREANKKRLPEFKNKHGQTAHARPDGSDWDFATWMMATIGELGEAAEIRLHLENQVINYTEYEKKIAAELADVATYLDIMALRSLDLPLQEEDDRPDAPTDAHLIMVIVALLGNVANSAKKFYRGDIQRNEYLEKKQILLDRMIKLTSSLMASYGVKAEVLPRATHKDGIDLGKAIIEKFNEVSDRVGTKVKLERRMEDSFSSYDGNVKVIEE